MNTVIRNAGIPALVLLTLAGCATVPQGPNVAVMPGVGKSFDQFVTDERVCRAYADESIGTKVTDAGANNVVSGAAVGTVVGAAAGALLGGHHGAESGAGAGLLMGSAIGASNASGVQYDAQRRYDIAYQQCMYAKGNQIPQTYAVPTTTYYRYGRRPVTVYQQPPTTVIYQSPPEQMPPPPPSPVTIPPPPPPGY
jgi:hypothetical protein